MLYTTDMRSYAISLIVQLSQDRLIPVVQLLEYLVEPPQQHRMSASETQLLETIGHHLPEDDRVRLNILRDRGKFGELSETEHQELIRSPRTRYD